MKWRLIEEFGPDCYEVRTDGELCFHGFYTDMDSLLSWVLTFGDTMKVTKPAELPEKLLENADRITKMYKEMGPT